MSNYIKTIAQLKYDWEKIMNNFPILSSFENNIKVNNDYSNINDNEYTLIINNSEYILKKESDFGKIYRIKFDNFEDLEFFLFKTPIDKYIYGLKQLKVYNDNQYLLNIIQTNIKYLMWSSISESYANKLISSLDFSLRVSLTQVTNTNQFFITSDGTNMYILCEKSDYEFGIIKRANKFEVIYQGKRYYVYINNQNDDNEVKENDLLSKPEKP